MDPEQFQTFLTALNDLTKQMGKQGQEIMQFTAAVKEDGTKGKGAKSSIHNPANKPKISVKLLTYSGELNKNIFLWCKQLQTIFKVQGIENTETEICYASTALTGSTLHWYLNQQGDNGQVP